MSARENTTQAQVLGLLKLTKKIIAIAIWGFDRLFSYWNGCGDLVPRCQPANFSLAWCCQQIGFLTCPTSQIYARHC
jgi:hypothetical protein